MKIHLKKSAIYSRCLNVLTHWGRVTHICVSSQTIIGSDNGLSPGRRQAIIWTSAGILLIGPLGANVNEIVIEIDTFSFKKMHLTKSSVKWRPLCPGLNVLRILAKLRNKASKRYVTVIFIPLRCAMTAGWIIRLELLLLLRMGPSFRYWVSINDKTVVWPSYLSNGNR